MIQLIIQMLFHPLTFFSVLRGRAAGKGTAWYERELLRLEEAQRENTSNAQRRLNDLLRDFGQSGGFR